MTISIHDAGAWKSAAPYAKDAGSWKTVQNGYVKDAGAWKEFFTAEAITLTSATYTWTGGTPTEYHVNFGSDGHIWTRTSSTLTDRGLWLTNPANIGLYEARATVTSGTLGGSATGVWLSCASDIIWSRGAAINTSQSASFTLEIRRASDGVVLGSANITLICDRT